ncbi:MAG: hypothetical protein PHY78_04480 [Desulfobacterales bacterium]|nr:hypothetical protein [Desulfobacterales bacterium]MDD4392641.1 hypothetical protein [Desulfobacterales bacterium]
MTINREAAYGDIMESRAHRAVRHAPRRKGFGGAVPDHVNQLRDPVLYGLPDDNSFEALRSYRLERSGRSL